MAHELLYLRVSPPHAGLSRYVQSYWTVETPAGALLREPKLRYLHPDGGHGIMLNFGDPVLTNTGERRTGFTVGSKLLAPSTLRFSGRVRMTGIRFRPHGAYPFFRTSTLCEDACRSAALRVLYEQVGYTPKQLARIARARRAKQVLAALDGKSLSEVTYGLGYSDQAHFTREFSALIGIPPAEYRACVAKERKR